MGTYLPIEFIRKSDEANMNMFGRTFDSMYDAYKIDIDESVTKKEFFEHVLAKSFLIIPDKRFIKMDRKLIENANIVAQSGNANIAQIATEWRDAIIGPDMFYRWSETKQVYKIDKDFYSMLLNTRNLTVEKQIMKHLPMNEFYIDLSDLNLTDIHGCYVWIDWIGETTYLTFYILTYDSVFFSNYISFNYDDEGKNEIDKDLLVDNESMPIADLMKKYESDIEKANKCYNTQNKNLSIFILQLLMYIGSEMPDITESALTKQTYRPRKPGAPIKNKFSETQIFEVGYKLGSNFRKKINEIKKTSDYPNNTESKTHASPMPHIRCAHWHKYWTGEGRTKLIVKWVEQTFVGFGEEAKEAKIATIHHIKKED